MYIRGPYHSIVSHHCNEPRTGEAARCWFQPMQTVWTRLAKHFYKHNNYACFVGTFKFCNCWEIHRQFFSRDVSTDALDTSTNLPPPTWRALSDQSSRGGHTTPVTSTKSLAIKSASEPSKIKHEGLVDTRHCPTREHFALRLSLLVKYVKIEREILGWA